MRAPVSRASPMQVLSNRSASSNAPAASACDAAWSAYRIVGVRHLRVRPVVSQGGEVRSQIRLVAHVRSLRRRAGAGRAADRA